MTALQLPSDRFAQLPALLAGDLDAAIKLWYPKVSLHILWKHVSALPSAPRGESNVATHFILQT